jgi:hypothetical protein
MDLTWFDATLLTLLFGIGSLLVQSLTRQQSAHRVGQKRHVACARHDWVRAGSRGLVCQACGKIPG